MSTVFQTVLQTDALPSGITRDHEKDAPTRIAVWVAAFMSVSQAVLLCFASSTLPRILNIFLQTNMVFFTQ